MLPFNSHNSAYQSEQEVLIVGGGLAGLLAAVRLTQANIPIVLIDESLPDAKEELGGFARFSGAKFSPPPAGMGLVRLVGWKRFIDAFREVSTILGFTIIDRAYFSENSITKDERISGNIFLRPYQSILLSSSEVGELIAHCSRLLENATLIKGRCVKIEYVDGRWFCTISNKINHDLICLKSRVLFFTAGRTGASILTQVGLVPRDDKGVDLGIRIEVFNKSALARMREIGPDAKLLYNQCRTFCLNFPGKMYRYPFNGISIAGGIVSEEFHESANIGLLFRATDKQNKLQQVIRVARELGKTVIEAPYECKGDGLGSANDIVAALFGEAIRNELQEFKAALGTSGLADWSKKHVIHLPLLDWHWPIFSGDLTFAANLKGLYLAGDVTGHARGLLQAALSGWLAAEEFLT